MNRIARGNSATISHIFYVDGIPTNPSPDAATVTITRDDGTVLVNAAAATEAGTGVVTYTLTPTQTALLDALTVSWTATFGGQSQTFIDIVEIVGGFLFTIAEARAVKPLDNTTAYTLQMIRDTRTLVEEALEDACGVAFVPRYKRETVMGTGSSRLVLSQPRVTAVRSISAITDTTSIVVHTSGVIYYPAGFARDTAYIVSYEHGHPSPPLPAKQAALALAKKFLLSGPVDDRTTTMSTEDGTYVLSTPGMRGAIWGVPVADSFAAQYSQRACIA